MRRLSICALLVGVLSLTACTEGPAVAQPNQRQQTSTAVAIQALTPRPTRTPQPTSTPFVPPTTTPTINLAPVTVTPISSNQASPTPEESQEVEPTATSEPTATPEPTAEPEGVDSSDGFLFFKRNGSIWRYDIAEDREQQVLPQGSLLRAAPDGSQIAVVRDGTLTLLSPNGRSAQAVAENVIEPPVWSPDGDALLIVTGPQAPAEFDHACAPGSTLLVLELDGNQETELGSGCQPAWDTKGQRIAYVTEVLGNGSQASNALNLVNREGQNGWTVVSAPVLNANFPDRRRIFYAPFWSEDGKTLYSLSYVGYRALSDVSTLEQIDPINGGTVPIGVLFDVVPSSVRVNSDGTWVTYSTAGARGISTVVTVPTSGESQTFQYIDGPIEVQVLPKEPIEYANQPVWSPEANIIAVISCETERPQCPSNTEASIDLINPQTGRSTTLLENVDPDSFLEWSR